MSDLGTEAPYRLDKRWIRRSFERAARDYERVAVLQREIGERMLERLDLIKLVPDTVLDLGTGTGRGLRGLRQRYRRALVVALDISLSMLQQVRNSLSFFERRLYRNYGLLCGDAEHLPLASRSLDMIFSNLTLQWCNDPDRVFEECHRVLKPGGLLMFSTFGPDTLKELRESWRQADGYNHVNAFIDMHDIGDALVRAHFADPVMDVEYFTLTYPDAYKLMRDLKALGSHNVTAGRSRGLTGKARLEAMLKAYEGFRQAEGVLPASYEVIYGHAWVSEAIKAATVPLSQVQRRAKRSR